MRKRLFAVLLAVALLAALCACTQSQTSTPTEPMATEPTIPAPPEYQVVEPAQKNGVYQLTEPGHLLYLAAHPDKDYALCADINMCGYIWTPVDTFSGTLTGLIYDVYNYTISNLQIAVAAGDTYVGFFRKVTGTVKEINFDSVSITVADSFSGNMGIVAGQCDTVLTDVDATNCTIDAAVINANVGVLCGKTTNLINGCYTSGAMHITLSGGAGYLGGAIGRAENLVMNHDARTAMQVTGTGAGATGGIVGYAGSVVRGLSFGGTLNINTSATHGAASLVGELASGGMVDSYNCARKTQIVGAATASEYVGILASGVSVTGCMSRDLSNLDENLPAAEQALRQKVADYMYAICTVRWIPTQDISHTDSCGRHDQNYKAGQVYIGMPYSHTSNSLDKFMSYLNADGTVKDGAYAMVGATSPNGFPVIDVVDFMGNDCADAVYWAWAQICGDISYTLTDNVLKDSSIVPVGDYTFGGKIETTPIVTGLGQTKMYEIYAKVQMGDGLLYAPGHLRMAAEASYVFRNADGSIDGEKSYILIHEQGAGCTTLDTRHTTCNTYKKFTFSQLYKAYYIPVTIPNFAEASVDTLTATTTNTDQTKTGVGVGIVSANFRLDRLTLKITDSTGKAVLDTFCHPVYGDHELSDHVTSQDLSVFAAEIAAAQLEAGKQYTYSVYVSAGEQEVCVQTFQFTA